MKNGRIVCAVLALSLASSLTLAQEARETKLTTGSDATAVVNVEDELRRAESVLAEAANRVARLSTQRLPEGRASTLSAVFSGRPMLGITLSGGESGRPVDGAEIVGVSPGWPADEAGLQVGDVIVAIAGVALDADEAMSANRRLRDIVSEAGTDNALAIEYLRDGRSLTTSIMPRILGPQTVTLQGAPSNMAVRIPSVWSARTLPAMNRHFFLSETGGLGDLEMVSLTPELGEYFGADEGMLVVRAPENSEVYKLEDGDVILDIDGRQPRSVPHAVQILSTYQFGESLSIRIMRKQRERTLEIDMPERPSGAMALPTGSPINFEVLDTPMPALD